MNKRSIEIRKKIVFALHASRRGHLAPAFSIVEILLVLYDDILHYKPSDPNDLSRDRFILSKGHGCLALYALLADKGFITEENLNAFCTQSSLLGGHPEHHIPGVEASTGSLGHGLSIGIGMALSARNDKRTSRVYVLVGDGECNEGSIWEAAMCAAKHKLGNLTVIVDYNKQQSYGPTAEIMNLEPFADKWESFGFDVKEVDGHSITELQAVFNLPTSDHKKPKAVICHTIKGKGIGYMENNPTWHHKSNMSIDDINALMKTLDSI